MSSDAGNISAEHLLMHNRPPVYSARRHAPVKRWRAPRYAAADIFGRRRRHAFSAFRYSPAVPSRGRADTPQFFDVASSAAAAAVTADSKDTPQIARAGSNSAAEACFQPYSSAVCLPQRTRRARTPRALFLIRAQAAIFRACRRRDVMSRFFRELIESPLPVLRLLSAVDIAASRPEHGVCCNTQA